MVRRFLTPLALSLGLQAALAPLETWAALAPVDDASRHAGAATLAQLDEAWARRDEAGGLEALRAAQDDAAAAAPDDYEVLWRRARLFFWLADDPALADAEKSKLGKQGWDAGEQAIAREPDRVEGWHYASAGIGNYALGIGVFRALREGIEGKFKAHLARAEALDPAYLSGGIQTAWGLFWQKLPWPKYDAKKSERALRAALARNPDNVRAHVYLAQLYRREGRQDEAAVELGLALTHPPGRYDAPEERRYQGVAQRLLDVK